MKKWKENEAKQKKSAKEAAYTKATRTNEKVVGKEMNVPM